MALFVHGGVPPLYIWDLFCCRCFQMLKLQPKFFLISINWRVAFQVWGKRAGENFCIYSILGKLPWAACTSQIKVQNLNLYSLLHLPPNPIFALADKSQVKFPCCLARVSSPVISSSGPWTSYKLGWGVSAACVVCVRCLHLGALPGHFVFHRVFPTAARLRTLKCVGEQLVMVAEGCSRSVSAGFISKTLNSSTALASKPRLVAHVGQNIERLW